MNYAIHRVIASTAITFFSMNGMEQQPNLVIPYTVLPLVTALHEKTKEFLADFTCKNEKNARNLLEIIQTTDNLKTKNTISEQIIGAYIYSKEPTFPQLFSNSQESQNKCALFFKQLQQYNHIVDKNGFIHPTVEQWKEHLKQQYYEEIILKASRFGIPVPEKEIKNNPKLFVHIPVHVAVEYFDSFFNKIFDMIHEKPETLEMMALMLYSTYNSQNKCSQEAAQ